MGDHLRTLRRPAAMAAMAAALGGAVAVLAPVTAAWRLTARVRALDTVGDQSVTTLPGAETSPLVWGVAAIGAVVVVVALLVALDRPPPRAETVLLLCGTAIEVAVVVLLARAPGSEAFAGRQAAADLVGGDVTLPTGIDIDLTVVPAAGLWALAGAGLVVILGTVVAMRRG